MRHYLVRGYHLLAKRSFYAGLDDLPHNRLLSPRSCVIPLAKRSTSAQFLLRHPDARPFSKWSSAKSDDGQDDEKVKEQASSSNGFPVGFYPPQQNTFRDAALTTIMGLGMGESRFTRSFIYVAS